MAKAPAKVKEESTEVAVAEDISSAMIEAAGEGANFDRDDMAIPFLRVLQKMSPQLSRKNGEYIEGAQEGMIMNTVTGELWEQNEGLFVIPCHHHFKQILWKPRDSGGGFVAAYERGDPNTPATEPDSRGRDVTGDGNILTPTSEHYVLIIGDEGYTEPALIAMSSTQLKVSRRWCAYINQQKVPGRPDLQAPSYSRIYNLRTIDESNEQGDWCSWAWETSKVVDNIDIFKIAQAFHRSISEGDVKTEYKSADPEVM